VRIKQIKMTEETREDVPGKGEAVRGSGHEGKSLRSEQKVFVIGQWSFVIGHFKER
jgi:hypothetical protein